MQSDKSRVDAYLERHPRWQPLMVAARRELLACGLQETVKWGAPMYTLDNSNLVGMVGFKNHCALWFHNGVYLQDPEQRLVKARQGQTRGLRQWRFEAGDSLPVQPLRDFLAETLANHQAGKVVTPRKPTTQTLSIPEELAAAMQQNSQLQSAFAALTPGRQREYARHIGSAKQRATRLKRLQKAIPLIESGTGLHDRYRKCR